MDVPAALGGGCEEKTTLFSYAAQRSWQGLPDPLP